MWVGLLAVVLLFPLMLAFVSTDKLPTWVQQIVAWLPTTAVFDLIRLSFGNAWLPELVWPKITAVLVATILVFALAGWRFTILGKLRKFVIIPSAGSRKGHLARTRQRF